MEEALILSRMQFAMTAGYHFLFPPLSMGLALLVFILKSIYMRNGNEIYNRAARFWGKIFAVTFIMGVVTGIPMEFQFGTNWSAFSAFAGDIIAQTLAMEGAFAFFLESAFVGLFLFGERRFGQRVHWFSALMVWLGTWASGYFIITTNAWLQNPVGFERTADGGITLNNYWAVLTNPWMVPQLMHTIGACAVTGAFVMAGLGAYYVLSGRHPEYGKIFLKLGVIVGLVASVWQIFPSGDLAGAQVTRKQPAKLAAMEGVFETERGAGIVILGQPNMETLSLDNPLVIPEVLSILTHQRWGAEVKGLDSIPRDQWPDNVPLVYYSYHIMVGLGTIFVGIMVIAAFLLWRGKLFESRWALWLLMLAVPFPFIANIGGWFTAEIGRQPWIAYGLLRTEDGISPLVSSGSVLFTLMGFAGIYTLMGLLYIVLMVREVAHGPESEEGMLGLPTEDADEGPEPQRV
ncbi:MAG: cytochrome ubiquinol oxidase subunit I [Rubrobacteraceae bacterium]